MDGAAALTGPPFVLLEPVEVVYDATAAEEALQAQLLQHDRLLGCDTEAKARERGWPRTKGPGLRARTSYLAATSYSTPAPLQTNFENGSERHAVALISVASSSTCVLAHVASFAEAENRLSGTLRALLEDANVIKARRG